MSYPPLGFDSVFAFGKHKGSTVSDVLDDDPGYIEWAIDKGIKFDPDVIEAWKMADEVKK